MKSMFQLVAVCLLVLSVCIHAETLSAQTLNGVSFECSATPKSNINGDLMASLVQVKVTSSAAKRMNMKFNVVITSDKGRMFTTGYSNGKVGKPIMPQDSYTLPYTPFDKVGPQDEFPKSCQITDLQVCPYYPPASKAKPTPGTVPAYYDAFHQGVPAEGCRNAVNLPPVDLPIPSGPKSCMAVVRGWVNNSLWNQYGDFKRGYWVHGVQKADDALAQATTLAQADGFRVGDPNYPPIVDCEHSHGAVVGLRKIGTAHWVIEPFGVWDFIGAAAGNSKKEAEQSAMISCNAMLTGASMIEMYVNHGITSCELLASW